MRPERPGDALWDRMNPFEKVLAMVMLLVVVVIPTMLALVEVIERSFK